MNTRDSEAVAGLFLRAGYRLIDEPQDADVILVNTCSVRAHAEERAISVLGMFNAKIKSKRIRIKPRKKPRVIGLIGCMAQNRGQEILRRMAHVNLVCGPANLDKIVGYVQDIQKSGRRIIDLADRRRDEDFYSGDWRESADHAQVVISTGCANSCAYCVVPFVRGGLRLRGPDDILAEARRDIAAGKRKITLLGQNVNDYNYKSMTFVDLLARVAELDGLAELNFLACNPRNTTRQLFELIATSPKIKKDLHLPFQAGSDRILKAMNRGYTRRRYLELVAQYRKITGGHIGTDVIVGFPGETKADFLKTKELMEQVKFNYAYIFVYSPRPHSLAYGLVDDVPAQEKSRRHNILLELQKDLWAKSRRRG